MSLSFLGKKSFHPSNPRNLKKLFQAEERQANEEKRAEELKREHEAEETRRQSRSMLEKGAPAEAPPSTSFMYQLPPGLREAQEKQKSQAAAAAAQRREAAADAAAAAAAAAAPAQGDAEAPPQTRADRDAERFAILKHAPRAGSYTTDIAVHHRPFGVSLRQVKCSRCGEWGHAAGDRECKLRHEVTEADNARKTQDDPIARASAGAEASGTTLRWAPKAAPEAGMHGGGAQSDENQQFVLGMDEEEAAALAASGGGGPVATLADLDPTVLSMLDEKQQRQLLKMYQKEQRRGEDGDGERKRKKHKHDKHKSSKHHKKHKSGHKHEKRDKADESGSDDSRS